MLDKDWRRHYGDGSHPPACTCVQCNEGNGRPRRVATATSSDGSGSTGGRSVAEAAYSGNEKSGNSGCGKLVLWGLVATVAIVAVLAFAGINSDDIRRLFAPPEPTPAPIVVVITATPADTPTSTSTPIPTPTPTSTNTPTHTSEPTSTATHTPVPTATLRPTFTPTVTRTSTPTATGTSTSTSTITPTITPTAFVCGYAEMVLIGAGKKHKHCHTPTPTLAPGVAQAVAPTHTPEPSNTLTPIPVYTNTPIPTNTPRVVVVHVSANSPTATATSISTPVYTPTPETNGGTDSSPHLRHLEEKQYMLKLINEARENAGVLPIELGNNAAAQLHADASLANCFSSHWGMDGLKPYMRYSLAGGYQSNGENGSGSDYCIKASDGYAANRSVEQEIDQAMAGLMSSPGHRRNILKKWHRKVNIGLAWDRYNFQIYQHFEGDYVEYDQLPTIENGRLSFSGVTKNGVQFSEKKDLGVQIYYDPPPHELTKGQVSRTYCYDNGLPVAALRQPLDQGWRYNQTAYTRTYKPCLDPRDVPADAPPAQSHDEARDLWEEAYNASKNHEEQTIHVPWITASEWTANGERFSVTANINEVLKEHRRGGVYTILVWGNIDGERAVISEYSIFHGVTSPDTYTPR